MQQTPPPWKLFLEQLSEVECSYLTSLHAASRQPPPQGWVTWACQDRFLGYLPTERAHQVCENLPECRWQGDALQWNANGWERARRGEVLQDMLVHHKEQGLVTGWRNEHFDFWSSECDDPDPAVPAFLSAERAGFRYLGMMSHAVHINGFLPDGRIWCGRRSATKATDPGCLDNLAAGGLPSGETLSECALRELKEEAGLSDVLADQLFDVGFVRTSREEPQGWHDEALHVRNLVLDEDFLPENQDGEVQAFLCLKPSQVLELIRQAQFTSDAVAALVQGLL
jgi:ADP-ribose pyrophosphatase YjhB (NUDIX family)